MNKRIISAILAAIMLSTIAVGCGEQSSSSTPTSTSNSTGTPDVQAVSEPITMVSVINGEIPAEDCVQFEKLLQDGKYNFEVTSLDRNVINERVALMLSTNQYPDVFFKMSQFFSAANTDKYGLEGILIPLNDLIASDAPNLSAYMAENDVVAQNITSLDGNIYMLPSIDPGSTSFFPTWLNQTWMDNLDLEMPTNSEELYNVLKAFKDQDANGNGDPNDEIPIMLSWDPMNFVIGWMPITGYKVDKTSITVMENDILSDARTTEGFKETIRYTTRLFQEGLLDNNAFVQTVAQAQAIGKGGDVTGCTGGASPTTYTGTYAENFTSIRPFYDDIFYEASGVNVTSALSITNKATNPALIMEWADQLYTEEASLETWMGVEGVNYQYIDDAKTQYEWIVPEGESVLSMRQKAGLQGIGMIPSIKPAIYNGGSTDTVQMIVNEEMEYIRAASNGFFPILRYNDADTKTVAAIEADVSAYVKTYVGKVITGELDLDESWNDYLDTLSAMRVDQMVEIKQAAYDALI